MTQRKITKKTSFIKSILFRARQKRRYLKSLEQAYIEKCNKVDWLERQLKVRI